MSADARSVRTRRPSATRGSVSNALEDADAWLAVQLPLLIAKHKVPGAAVAVLARGEIIERAAGVLSVSTRVEATVDSVFQIGSITKVWTATLIMQLVDEEALDLDAPLRRYLPEFRIADESAAASITVRQLLKHTAGFGGDIFVDTGPGDDCIEKYLEALHPAPQLFTPDELYSYNNAGYSVLGRLVEVLRAKPYDRCVHDHLIAPLGLTHTATGPYQAIMFRAATGHVQLTTDDDPEPAPVWAPPRSGIAAGAMLSMRPRDLLGFAALHMNGGLSANGERVLAASSVAAMQETQAWFPELGSSGTFWGLGWELLPTPDGVLIGHEGNTFGQDAFLRVASERGVAIALLTNGGGTYSLYRDLCAHLLPELAGIHLPDLPAPPSTPKVIDATRYVGTYSNEAYRVVVSQEHDGRIWMDITSIDEPDGGHQLDRKELVHYSDDRLISLDAQDGEHRPYAFVGDDGQGRALFMHGGRAVRRTGTPPESGQPDRSSDVEAAESSGAPTAS